MTLTFCGLLDGDCYEDRLGESLAFDITERCVVLNLLF